MTSVPANSPGTRGCGRPTCCCPATTRRRRWTATSPESVKHSEGVSKDLREGLRVSVELLAGEVLRVRRERGLQVEGIADLPREMIRQSLRFLYRILFLLFAEARPELGVLPAGDPDYAAGYGLDRLRELAQVELATPQARDGHHIHDSLRLLFRLVNEGHPRRR